MWNTAVGQQQDVRSATLQHAFRNGALVTNGERTPQELGEASESAS